MLFVLYLIVGFLLSFAKCTTIKGKLDLPFVNISNFSISRTYFSLYQIGNYSTNEPYYKKTGLQDSDGNFEFSNLPINSGINETTHFVLYSTSLDFNLKPNRILIEFKELENGTITSKAFKNFFGREYFPSNDIIHPEHLEAIEMEPYITISEVNMAPYRSYFQVRNVGILQSGPLASILNSRWKSAAVLSVILLAIFPFLVEKFDPETTKAMKQEALAKKRKNISILHR
ncbi:Sop4p NDAI_0B00440 [Naumovozyma dairenensis CBS 421]|uniref:Protein SOP4 n=1 Tax=Naumovozyma dairenensis (strain ATCC 10597 / BCRC 20456 / CBS 421 / NBRC 0211 / NRRL Y-12639) TaxID=1071378 RepID=G0W5L7_NAUDC|nr:hypothetical protein NDAI_0B00440 [Naumovozyma dairenensis CBS 421]CCD23078.1 hypothetical protein NDAI_0B00440 [Naumovozyma dairenensis CBS 421]